MQVSLIALAVICLSLTEGIELVDDGHGGWTIPLRNFTKNETRGWIETFIEVDGLKSEDVDSIVDCTKQGMHRTDVWYSFMKFLETAEIDLEGDSGFYASDGIIYPKEGSNIVKTFIRFYHHHGVIIHNWLNRVSYQNKPDECSKSFLQLIGEVLSQHLLLDPPHNRNDPDSQWFNLFVDSYVYSVSGWCPSAHPVCRILAGHDCPDDANKACPYLGYDRSISISASTSEYPCGKFIESLDHLAKFACPNAWNKYCHLTRESILASKEKALEGKRGHWISWNGTDPYDCASWMEKNICVN